MRFLLLFLILISISCSKDCHDIERINLTCNDQCDHEEFHITFLENGACFNSIRTLAREEKGVIYLVTTNTSQNKYGGLYIRIKKDLITCDTMYFGVGSFSQDRSSVDAYFPYSEDDQILGSFDIPDGEGTKEDYLLIDYVNEDTTEIAGRFQVEFTEIEEGLPIEVPTTLSITCGTFKCKIEN